MRSYDLDNRLSDWQREYGRVIRSASPRRSRYTQPSSFPPSCTVQRPGFSTESKSGYLNDFINTACAAYLASNARLRLKQRSPQESQTAPHRGHLASGAAALGCSHLKNGSHTHAHSSLCQQVPRRKARSWRSKKALQRSAEQTACTGGNQPSVMAAGSLGPRQSALISKKSQSRI